METTGRISKWTTGKGAERETPLARAKIRWNSAPAITEGCAVAPDAANFCVEQRRSDPTYSESLLIATAESGHQVRTHPNGRAKQKKQ